MSYKFTDHYSTFTPPDPLPAPGPGAGQWVVALQPCLIADGTYRSANEVFWFVGRLWSDDPYRPASLLIGPGYVTWWINPTYPLGVQDASTRLKYYPGPPLPPLQPVGN